MKYETLEKILRKYDRATRDEEYDKRFNSYTSIKVPLYIHSAKTQLFCVINLETMYKIESIQKKLGQIRLINSKNKDNIFYTHYINKLFDDELIATNEIEGVATSEKEINTARANVNYPKDSKPVRFEFLVKKYTQLLNGDEINLKNAEDIRTLYDELLEGEIPNKDKPDGKIFRKDSVDVLKRYDSHKKVHTGVMPESTIILYVNQLLNFVNNDDHINDLVKIAISHYYFGYIHPFYDGNGRLNRFISSYLISKCEHEILALKLSKVIKDNINNYDKAFEITNNILNMGEVTFFVEMFIDVLWKAAKEIVEELNYFESKLDEFVEHVTKSSDFGDIEVNVLFMIYQNYLCEKKNVIKYLVESSGLSEYKIKITLESLNKKGYVNYQKRQSIALTDKFFNSFKMDEIS